MAQAELLLDKCLFDTCVMGLLSQSRENGAVFLSFCNERICSWNGILKKPQGELLSVEAHIEKE